MSPRIRTPKKRKANQSGPLPNLDRLYTFFQFDPVTGNLTYSITGELAGSLHSSGYLVVYVDGVRYFLHHIAYAMFHRRAFRHGVVTHKNRIKTDNRIENLQFKKRRSTKLSGEADKG